MLAVASVEPAKGKSAAAAASPVPSYREPTPDHPPYSWMIGEAIEALGEDGGSAEAAISSFIRGKHSGVPASHDNFLRYYLAKHVAEGLFVCTVPGRYSRRTDESALQLAEVKLAATPSAGSPATEAKRGRGRPRKDGSLAPSAGKASGSKSPSTTPKRRRGRPRKLELATTTDITDKIYGSEAPSTTEKNHGKPHELALAMANGTHTTASVAENENSKAPSAKLALVDKDDGAAPFTTPELAPVPAHSSAQASVTDKRDGTEVPPAKYTFRRRACKSAPVEDTLGSSPTSISDKKVDGKAVSVTPKGRGRQCKLALVAAVAADSTPTITPSKQDGNEAPSIPAENHGQPCKDLALVIANEGDATPSSVENDGGDAPTSKLAVMAKEDDSSTLMPMRSTQPCKLVPMPADDGSTPASVANKTDGTEAPSAMYKRLRRACRSAPVNAVHSCTTKSIAGKKIGGKVVSPTPNNHSRQPKPVAAAAGDSAPTLTTGKKDGDEAQPVPVKPQAQPHKLFLLPADEMPDDPMFCVLALPAEMLAITINGVAALQPGAAAREASH